jgi:hypothetical protein
MRGREGHARFEPRGCPQVDADQRTRWLDGLQEDEKREGRGFPRPSCRRSGGLVGADLGLVDDQLGSKQLEAGQV